MKQVFKLTDIKRGDEPKKKIAGKQRTAVTRDYCRAMQTLRSAIKRTSGPTVCGPDRRSLAFSQALQGRRTPRRRCRRIALLGFRPELSGYKPRSGDQCCLRPRRSP